MNNPPPAKRPEKFDKSASIHDILRENRPRIIGAWHLRLAQWQPTTSLTVAEEQSQLLNGLFEELIAILHGNSTTPWTSVLRNRPTTTGFATSREVTPSGFIHFFSGCAEDLLALLEKSPAMTALERQVKDFAVRQIESACAILIHREAHAFAEQCGKMLRSLDSTGRTIANYSLSLHEERQQSA